MPETPPLPEEFTLDDIAVLIATAAIVVLAYFLVRWLLLRFGLPVIRRINKRLAELLEREHVLPAAALLGPSLVMFIAQVWLQRRIGWAFAFISQAVGAYTTSVIGLTLYRLLNALEDLFIQGKDANTVPVLRTLFRWLRIATIVGTVILALGVFANVEVTWLLTAFGLVLAAGSIVFGDMIYNSVSTFILKGRELVKVGDWLEIPSLQINGAVKAIGSQLIEVQNWDNTLATVTPRYLMTNTFRNWQQMYQIGNRRILRYLYIDVTTVRPLDDQLVAAVRQLPGIAPYLDERSGDYSSAQEAMAHLTNVALYRAYLMNFLATHPKVAKEQIWRVTNEDTVGRGLPLLMLAYLTETQDIPYRLLDAELYEYALAAAPQFGLRLFQDWVGMELSKGGTPS